MARNVHAIQQRRVASRDGEVEAATIYMAQAPAASRQSPTTTSANQSPQRKINNTAVKVKEAETHSVSISRPMSTSRAGPLLICSIGNPGSTYANTLHSAGHTVLDRLANHLGYTQFQKERAYGNGKLSGGGTGWTLWQSTSYMNESGKGVKAAYMTWSRNVPDGEGRLVVVHDELEKPLGAVSLKTGQGLSARGHNGLKSILSVMGNTPFVRIGIGIGRPVSRDRDDVAKYVLKKMSPVEKAAIEGSIEQVVAKLQQLEAS